MSLKAFHIVFITLSSGLALGFGVWCLSSDPAHEGVGSLARGSLAMGLASFGTAGLLIVYGAWFLRKLRSWG